MNFKHMQLSTPEAIKVLLNSFAQCRFCKNRFGYGSVEQLKRFEIVVIYQINSRQCVFLSCSRAVINLGGRDLLNLEFYFQYSMYK